MVLTLACFVVNMGGAAYTLDNGIEYSKLTPWIKQRFYDLIDKYEKDTRSRRIMDMIQEFVSEYYRVPHVGILRKKMSRAETPLVKNISLTFFSRVLFVQEYAHFLPSYFCNS
jgi:hypothetical protein